MTGRLWLLAGIALLLFVVLPALFFSALANATLDTLHPGLATALLLALLITGVLLLALLPKR